MRTAFVLTALIACATLLAQDKLPNPLPKPLIPLEKNYRLTKTAYLKQPKDKKLRDAFVKAATLYGHKAMMSKDLKTSVKYKEALRVYREVLKIEPKHPVAQPEHDLIVSIYKQMGRPVPK
jgi:tetratricopeptide (TPR) repeat protein